MDNSDLDNQLWQCCRRRGLIPGPAESPDGFKDRISRRDRVVQQVEIPEVAGAIVDWVTLSANHSKLNFWEGAATEADVEGCTEIVLGRRTLFCSEQHMLTHELLHAMREAFDMHVFEEILAWRTHPSRSLQYLALFALDAKQLVLAGIAMLGIALCACSDLGMPVAIVSLLPIALRTLPLLWTEYRTGKALERRGLPAKEARLHFSYQELVAMAWNSDRFWDSWERAHPFRSQYLKASLSVLYYCRGSEVEDAPTAVGSADGDADSKLSN